MGNSIVRGQDARRRSRVCSTDVQFGAASQGDMIIILKYLREILKWMRIDLFFKAHESKDSLMR